MILNIFLYFLCVFSYSIYIIPSTPKVPVYQNVDAKAHTNPEEIKQNLIAQLTAPVKWTYEVQAMIAAGATEFTECGPGKALQGMISKIDRNVTVNGLS